MFMGQRDGNRPMSDATVNIAIRRLRACESFAIPSPSGTNGTIAADGDRKYVQYNPGATKGSLDGSPWFFRPQTPIPEMADTLVPTPNHWGANSTMRIRLCARAKNDTTPLILPAPETRNCCKPRLRLWHGRTRPSPLASWRWLWFHRSPSAPARPPPPDCRSPWLGAHRRPSLWVRAPTHRRCVSSPARSVRVRCSRSLPARIPALARSALSLARPSSAPFVLDRCRSWPHLFLRSPESRHPRRFAGCTPDESPRRPSS